jgi:hypothetical protein
MQQALAGDPPSSTSRYRPASPACPHSGQRTRYGDGALLECFRRGTEPGAPQAAGEVARVTDEAPASAQLEPAVLDFFRSDD